MVLGDSPENLESAVHGETHEYTNMYPGMAKTARDEGFSEIADWFETLGQGREVARRSLRDRAEDDFLERYDGGERAGAPAPPPFSFQALRASARASVPVFRPAPQYGYEATVERIKAQPTDGLSYNATETKYWDRTGLDKEIERVFDVCNGCRLCFNLCPSFPALFDAAENNNGERARDGLRTRRKR